MRRSQISIMAPSAPARTLRLRRSSLPAPPGASLGDRWVTKIPSTSESTLGSDLMPADNRLRLDDHQRHRPPGPYRAEDGPEQSIGVGECRRLGRAVQRQQLVPRPKFSNTRRWRVRSGASRPRRSARAREHTAVPPTRFNRPSTISRADGLSIPHTMHEERTYACLT